MTITKEESARRLNVLADFLENDGVGGKVVFDMNYWMTLSDLIRPPVELDMQFIEDNVSGMDCGTSACALGHACLIPEFRKLGLKLVRNIIEPQHFCVTFKDSSGWWCNEDVARSFFHISEENALYIFNPLYDDEVKARWPLSMSWIPKAFVVDRIRKVAVKVLQAVQ